MICLFGGLVLCFVLLVCLLGFVRVVCVDGGCLILVYLLHACGFVCL